MESEAEMARAAEKRQMRKSKAAESTGETLLQLAIADSDPGLGGRYHVTFVKRNRELRFPWHRLKVGSPVLVARQTEDDDGTTWSGVVSRRNRDSLQVALQEVPDGDSFRIDLATDQITRKRCADALKTARQSKGRLGHMRNVLVGEKEPEFQSAFEYEPNTQGAELNSSQQEAVRFGLSAHDLAIIHGPPGTGKTTTLVELIVAATKRGDKVLACAPSNTAVDNLLMKLDQRGQRAVRIGHPARVADQLQRCTLDSLAAEDPNMRIAKEMMREAAGLFRKIERYTRSRPEPGMRRELRNEAKRLLSDARLMEKQAVSHVIDRAQVICATTTVDGGIFGDRWFDLLVIDEACQSTEPPCWIPVCRCDKVILAGDHCQLPPTVLSQAAAKEGFATSLVERLMKTGSDSVSRMLKVQYRMNDAIMQFSSQQFYDGQLTGDPSVTEHLLTDKYNGPEIESLAEPILFIDTAGASWNEEQEPDGQSRRNEQEAQFVIKQVQQLSDAGVPLQDVAVISPYAAQVGLIRTLAGEALGSEHQLEIDTVDGFQGREKEVVLISLVRSNEKNEIGFLADTRRMNVAMTRARRRLVMIGDTATIGSHDFYKQLLEYCESVGAYRSIWQLDITN